MRLPYLFVCWIHCVLLVRATTSNWTKPNGQLPDYTDTYTVGERIIVSWLALNDSSNDLWLTRYDTSEDDFGYRLLVALDISTPGSYDWTIGVATEDIQKDTRFQFQWLPTGVPFDPTQTSDLASPAFNLVTVNQVTPVNGTAVPLGQQPTSTSSTADPTSSATDSSSSTSTSSSDSGETGSSAPSTTVVVGLVAAGIGAASFIIAGATLLLKMHRRRKQRHTPPKSEENMDGPYEILGDKVRPAELSSKRATALQFRSKETLASEALSSPVYEMSTTIKRPGVHELPG